MNNACPECGAVYAVAEKDIGRRIACKKCNSALIVTEEGLVHDEAAMPRKDDTAERERVRKRDEDDRPRKRRGRDEDDDAEERPRKPRGPGLGEYVKKLKGVADVPTWLFGIGLVLTIYSFFSPKIDEAKIQSRFGLLNEEEVDMSAYERNLRDKPEDKPLSADEEKKLKEKRTESEKRKLTLNDDANYAVTGAMRGAWWAVMYRLLGFSLLAFGSIGFLASESMQRRILGGGTILLILLQVISGGASLDFHLGGNGPDLGSRPKINIPRK